MKLYYTVKSTPVLFHSLLNDLGLRLPSQQKLSNGYSLR